MFPECFNGFTDVIDIIASNDIEKIFEELIAKPLSQLHADHTPIVIVIDALDELPSHGKQRVLNLLTSQFRLLPKIIHIIVTSRDETLIRDRLIKSNFNPTELLVDEKQNVDDLRLFLTEVAKEVRRTECTPMFMLPFVYHHR